MQKQTVDLINLLKSKGLRKTEIRLWILDYLQSASTPVAAVDLEKALFTSGQTLHKSTLYRELDTLAEGGLISELDFGEGKKRYEFDIDVEHHHHHIFCKQCEDISCFDFEPDLSRVEKDIESGTGFKILSHQLDFFGICRQCQGLSQA